MAFSFQEMPMSRPVDPDLAEFIELLDEAMREAYEERAGIIQFDAGHSRGHAECLALLSVLRRCPSVLTRVTVFRVKQGGALRWLVTTDLATARRHVASVGGVQVGVVELAALLDEQFGGLAELAAFD